MCEPGSMAALDRHAAIAHHKGALDMLTKVMALELGRHGFASMRQSTVTLTPWVKWRGRPRQKRTHAGQDSLGRFARPREIAEAVAFLLGSQATMINGVALPVDGGFLAT